MPWPSFIMLVSSSAILQVIISSRPKMASVLSGLVLLKAINALWSASQGGSLHAQNYALLKSFTEHAYSFERVFSAPGQAPYVVCMVVLLQYPCVPLNYIVLLCSSTNFPPRSLMHLQPRPLLVEPIRSSEPCASLSYHDCSRSYARNKWIS